MTGLAKMMALSRVSFVCILILSGFGATFAGDMIERCINNTMDFINAIISNVCPSFPNPMGPIVMPNDLLKTLMNCVPQTTSPKNPVPLIVPTTEYCGAGNISKNGELGCCNVTDSCCRTHDRCPDGSIPAGETKWNLTNTGTLTRLNCTCDAALRKCLEDANSPIAEIVGILFNDIFKNPCITKDYPIVCEEYSNCVFFNKCVNYTKDMTKPQVYQFQDPQPWNKTRLLYNFNKELGNVIKGKC